MIEAGQPRVSVRGIALNFGCFANDSDGQIALKCVKVQDKVNVKTAGDTCPGTAAK